MRPTFGTFGALVALGAALAATGCAGLYDLGDYRVGAGDLPDGGSSSSGTQVPEDDGGSAQDDAATEGGLPRCTSNAECATVPTAAAPDAVAPIGSVCVKATGRCAPLLTEACSRVTGDWTNDDAIVVGALVGAAEASSPLEQAARLAVEEINQASGTGGLPPAREGGKVRPLVLLACDASQDPAGAARHLVDVLHVPAIVGPTSAERVVEVTQQVSAPGGTLLLSPTAQASAITNLSDGDLTWRAVPSDAQRAKLVIQQLNDLETLLKATRALQAVKLGVVYGTDASGTSVRDAITGKLILNGRFLADAANAANVSLDAYTPGSGPGLASVATKYATFRPDLVYVTTAEQVRGLMIPLEQALTAARAPAKPYYLLAEAARGSELVEAIASGALPADIRRRVRGVRLRPDAESTDVLGGFSAAYGTRYGAAPSADTLASASLAYDATYAIAYALASTADEAPSGPSVARGLRALNVGDSATVGVSGVASSLRAIAARRSVALRGTHALLRWDASGDLAAGTLEVWCVGAAGGASYGPSGLTMDVMTQVVGGAFVQCQ